MDIDECREKVAQMSKSIFQYCLSRTSSYQESEDLSQEILLTLCDSIANLRDEKAFYAFVWRTADNILKGWYRNKDKRNTAELDDTIWDAAWERLAEQTQENEQLTLIMRELALLNSNYRRVMVAYYIDGLSVRDISARFSLTQSMVKYLLFQSRSRIKEDITMERNFGELSYRPVELIPRSWGKFNVFHDMFSSRVKQNIMMACYYEKQTEEQISLQTGVPTAYLEHEIAQLLEHEFLLEKNGYYLSNIVIVTQKMVNEISDNAAKDADTVKANVLRRRWYENADEIAAFLACINPFWCEKKGRKMLYSHLEMTEKEAGLRLNKEYRKDIAMFGQIETEAMDMADDISAGIICQFLCK